MKNYLLGFLMLVFGGFITCATAQVDVTFQVDLGTLVPNPDGVSVAGDFQDEIGVPEWTPGATMMAPVGAGVYAVTVQLPAGTYYFKYINGIAWGADESVPGGCAFGGNRQLIVGEVPVVLDPVCFGSCTVCNPPEASVTFQVNMAEQTVSGDGVHIAGSFQDPVWQPGATAMTLAYDAVYEFTVLLKEGSYYEYKFINGNAWGADESVPGGCEQNGNRYLTVPVGGITIAPVCFGKCVDCEVVIPTIEITFQVDMSNETVSPDGIHIAGNFQDPQWQPGDTPMTDQGNGVYSYTATLPVGDFIEYKFVNGNSWDDPQPEQVPWECASHGNRFFTVPNAATTLDLVCFGSCDACVAPPSGGGMETFDNFTATGTSYVNGTFLGQDGSQWSYTQCRGDGTITGKSIMLGRSRTPQANFYSGTIPNGCGTIEFDYMQAFGTNVNLNVLINDVVVGNVTSSGELNVVKNSGVFNVNVAGDFVIKFINVNNSDGQVVVDNISWTGSGSVTTVATPVFSEITKEYFSPVDLEISCETEGSTIYYTLDGNDPDDNSTEYIAPIFIDATTTVKAIAYAPDLDPSAIAEVTLTFPTLIEVENLAALRAEYYDGVTDYFKVTGEVVLTFQQTFRNQKVIEDATAGVLIDDLPGKITTPYNIYDGITGIIGTINVFGGLFQFTPVNDPGAATSTGNVIIPQVITLDDLANNFEDYESELVEIKGVTFANAGANFANGQLYNMSDATGNGVFRTTFYDVDYIGTTIPMDAADVTGIPNSRAEGEYLTSRNLADIVVPDYLLLTAPTGGEQIEQGSEFPITWETNLTETTLDIFLNLTTHLIELATDVPVEEGSFLWDVTQPIGDYTIILRTSENLPDDESDDFAIVAPFDIKITEIMYNPPESGQDSLEYIEIFNNGLGTVNLNGWSFTKGVVFVFPDITLAPGEYAVNCVKSNAFMNFFGFEAPQWTSGSLSNSGEKIELSDNLGNIRAMVTYSNGGLWPFEANGNGPSLTFCDASMDNNDPANWSASTEFVGVNAAGKAVYGTPGAGCSQANVLPMFYSGGWTGISSNVEPGKVSMEALFAPINTNLVILLGKTGFYWPEFDINTLGEWNTYEGYKIKLTGSSYFVFEGAELADRTYAFEPGLEFVPVLSSESVNVADVIVPLGDAVEFMFDIKTGAIYWPAGGITPGLEGSLEVLTPGYAYLTRFTQAGTIDFDAKHSKATVAKTVKAVNNTTWNDVIATGDQHIIAISQQALAMLQAGDVIGMFDANGLCSGMATFTGTETVLPLVVYGDDNTTKDIDGMSQQEPMQCRIFRNGTAENVAVVYNSAFANADGLFEINGLSMIDGFKAGATGIGTNESLASIYPNPSDGRINIITDQPCDVTITNAQGQLIYQNQVAQHAVVNLQQQPKGVYFVTLTNTTQTVTQKIVIR
jgi:hypothetical protein